MVKVLSVGNEPNFCWTIAGSLRHEGYKVLTAADVADASAVIENLRPEVVVIGHNLPADSGIALLQEVSRRRSFLPVIMILEQSDLSRIREIMQAGAYDFMGSPVTADTLSRAIAQAVEAKRSVETPTRQFKCEIPAYLTMEEIEREAIKLTLERTRNNVKKTAQILDLHRPTLYRKLKKFGIRQ